MKGGDETGPMTNHMSCLDLSLGSDADRLESTGGDAVNGDLRGRASLSILEVTGGDRRHVGVVTARLGW